jgi:MFS family permease
VIQLSRLAFQGDETAVKQRKAIAPAMAFVLLMGIVSLFSDLTHEGARSIYGAYLSLAGASAAAIGFVSGFGELIGYSCLLITGIIADKSKQYWLMTMIGYIINLAAIPALALVPENGWVYACALIAMERVGRAIRKPAKNTLVSFASQEVGAGKSFAIQEFLDQIGAFLGPVLLFAVLSLKRGGTQFSAYSLGFAVLGMPAALTLVALSVAHHKYPNPEGFEKETGPRRDFKAGKAFFIYIAAISLFAFGFIDFPLITMHISKTALVADDLLPLLYAGAMLVDAFAALFFGWMYDKHGIRVLMLSTLISALFSVFIFRFNAMWAVATGIFMWGVGMGAQESILKSVVATIMPKEHRARGFGVFEVAFGIFWFLGSWLLGFLYDHSIAYMIGVSVAAQLLAIPLFYRTSQAAGSEATTDPQPATRTQPD